MRSFKLFAIAALVCLNFTLETAFAQSQKGIPSDGRDFYIVQLTPSLKCPNLVGWQGYWALISSYYDCTVTLSYFDAQQGGKEITGKTYVVPAKGGVQAPLDESFMNPKDANGNPLNIEGQVPMYSSCHIHATRPISVSYYSTGPVCGGLYMALQTGALGNSYVVAAMPANPGLGAANGHHASNANCQPDSASSEFAVIGVADNTLVTITPNGLTRRGNTGVNCGAGADGHPYPITTFLNRGQVYWVKSTPDDPSNDMSGSIVQADQPVAVIAGCEAAFNGITSFADRGGDQRNLSVEQMVPVDYWTDKDYVSMPMMQCPGGDPSDGSAGDQYKIFSYDKAGSTLTVSVDNISPYLNVPLGQFECPPLTFDNVEDGINIGSNNGQKIMVEMYQYRQMYGSAEPFTAPEQMNIIPLTRCRTSYMWQVPDDKAQVHKKRYINVIAQRTQLSHIFLWHNGVGPASLSGLSAASGNVTIPGHPELVGRTYEIYPGSYYAIGDSAFALYQYGDLGLDPDFDLGDNDDDDYYFSYASTCGISFGIDGAYSPSILADTLCDGWNLHVVDDNPLDRGISTLDILKDPNGVLKRKPGTDSGYMSVNVDFDPTDFTVVPGDTVVNVKIKVDNPLQDAWAYVWAVNGAGNDTLIYLYYTAPKLSFLSTQGPADDSANFINSKLGVDTCTQFVFKNLGKPGELTFHVTGYHFLNGSQGFRVTGTSSALPFTLAPGDSIVFDVCFNASQAAHVFQDTLVIETDCPTPIGALLGSTQVGEINASDYDFGNVIVGHTACHTVRVWNTGAAPFTLTKQWVLDNFENFSFPDSTMLPLTIQPGLANGVNLTFCYTPSQDTVEDSTQQHWASDLPEPFTQIKKNFSILKGHGIRPLLNWDTIEQLIITQCDSVRTVRCTLHNTGTAPIQVDTVEVLGPDASEFKIIGNQNNYVPLNPMTTAFTVYPVGEPYFDTTQWVDVQFTPDLTKPLPGRWKDRLDTLIAIDTNGIHPIVILNANVTHAEVDLSDVALDFGSTKPHVPTKLDTVIVTNGGTAPLIIQTITIDTPFTIVQPGSLKQWDTVAPNASKIVIVQGTMTWNGNDTGYLNIVGLTPLCSSGTVVFSMSSSAIQATALGHNFTPTYICTDNVDSVSATAGPTSLPVKVVSAQIVDDPGFPGESADFAFSTNGTHLLPIGQTLSAAQMQKYGVTYTPSAKQSMTADVIFTFDTASNPGKAPWTYTVKITGTGLQEHTIISVQNSQPGPYVAATASVFQVPIQMTQPIAGGADIHSVKMDISFKRDLFDPLATPVVAQLPYTVVNATVDQSADPAVIHLTIGRADGQPFDSTSVLANLQLRVMVAKDTMTNFIVSNVTFQNSAGTDVCYVLHDTIPASFIPSEYCSNGMLRTFMKTGNVAYGIQNVHPNPAANTVHLRLYIYQDGLPVTVELYNALGQLVRTYAHEMSMSIGAQGLDLDLSDVPSGAYSLRVTGPDHTADQMIVVQK